MTFSRAENIMAIQSFAVRGDTIQVKLVGLLVGY